MSHWKAHETTQRYIKSLKIPSVRCANISALNFLKLSICVARNERKGASRSCLSGEQVAVLIGLELKCFNYNVRMCTLQNILVGR
jgi:hypothetical protein